MLPHTQLNHSDPETSLPPQPPTPPPPPWTPANPSLVSGLWAQSPALTWTHQRSPSPLPGATGLRGLLPQAFASLDGRALTFPQSSHPLLPLLSPWPWPTTDGTSHPLGNCSVTLQDPPSSPTQDTSPGGQSTLSLAFHLVSRVPTQRVTQGALGDRRLNVKIHGEGLHLQDTLIHEEGHSATRQALLSRVKPLPQLSPRQRKERGGKGAGPAFLRQARVGPGARSGLLRDLVREDPRGPLLQCCGQAQTPRCRSARATERTVSGEGRGVAATAAALGRDRDRDGRGRRGGAEGGTAHAPGAAQAPPPGGGGT